MTNPKQQATVEKRGKEFGERRGKTSVDIDEVCRRVDEVCGRVDEVCKRVDEMYEQHSDRPSEADLRRMSGMLEPMEAAILKVADNCDKIAWMRVDRAYIRMHVTRGCEEYRCDLILTNRAETMAVELLQKLRIEDARKFIETDLPRFRRGFKEFAGKRAIYGAVAFSPEESDPEVIEQARKMAEDAGALLIQVEESGLKFINPEREKLRNFG